MRRWLAAMIAAVALAGLANIPVNTKQGVNFDVTTHRLPLYLKSLEFVERSGQYQQIADEITEDAATDTDRVLRVFEWTRRHIRQTPDNWPVVDDHILNIIIRGHGVNDQQADVFTTLSTYAGVPAFWVKVPPARKKSGLLLSFARVDGRWRVFDVANDAVFRTPRGELATLDDVVANPAIVPPALRALSIDDAAYSDVIAHAAMPPVPHPLRAELQMPTARLWHEVKASVHLESNDESH